MGLSMYDEERLRAALARETAAREAAEAETRRCKDLLRVCRAAIMCEWGDKTLGSAIEVALFKLMNDIDGVVGEYPTARKHAALSAGRAQTGGED